PDGRPERAPRGDGGRPSERSPVRGGGEPRPHRRGRPLGTEGRSLRIRCPAGGGGHRADRTRTRSRPAHPLRGGLERRRDRPDRPWALAVSKAEIRRAADLRKARRARTKAIRRTLTRRANRRYGGAIAAARRRLPALSLCTGDIPGLPAYTLIGRIPTAAYPT